MKVRWVGGEQQGPEHEGFGFFVLGLGVREDSGLQTCLLSRRQRMERIWETESEKGRWALDIAA